jgi:hypothetical protein
MTQHLEELLSDEILRRLPHDRNDPYVVSALQSMKVSDLTIRFANWIDRLVHPHPRRTHLSREICDNPKYNEHMADVAMIMLKAEQGDELYPHLSRSIRYGFSLPQAKAKSLGRRKDLDLMLNEWGVHHLHLSADTEADGFVKRNDYVLFVIFTDHDAYFIDLCRHGEWTNQRVVEIAVRNWPEADLFLTLNGVLPGKTLTAEERKITRERGVTTMVEVDGVVYVSRTVGISTAGISNRSTMKAIRLLEELRSCSKNLSADPHFFKNEIEKIGKSYPSDPEFRIELLKGGTSFGFGLREVKSQAIIPLYW